MNAVQQQVPTRLEGHSLSAGDHDPLGASFDGEGVNFAVFSAHADLVELCLFTDDGSIERARIPLTERHGDIWHVFVAGLGPGTRYGYRVHGPYEPEQGHRFNPHKLLLDPYAKKLAGRIVWNDSADGLSTECAKGRPVVRPHRQRRRRCRNRWWSIPVSTGATTRRRARP